MRWTDLPADSGAADAAASGPRRAQWEQLRQRLERLPAGHPSSADDDDPEAEGTDDDGALADAPDGDPGTGESAGGHDREQKRPDDPGRGEGGARPGGRPSPSRRAGGDTRAAGAGGRSGPYRPWFASGESAEPWFAADGQ